MNDTDGPRNPRKQKKGSQSSTPSRRVKDANMEGADWSTCDPNLLRAAIAAVGKQGGALRFGYTSDGGAYCVGILGDGEPYNDYIKPSEDVNDYLTRLALSWE